MSIFNSLGSNYSTGFAYKSLFSRRSRKDTEAITKILKEHYGGQDVVMTYKGREALELALRRSGLPPGSFIGINGFTCYVLYKAVDNAGFKPVFIDVGEGQMHFGLPELQAVHSRTPLKGIIIQNTLGYAADILAFEPFCRQTNIMMIEDLAHSGGALYEGGRETGTVSPLVMLSFSQDKALDVVAGGVLIDRRNQTVRPDYKLPKVSLLYRLRARTYPFLTTVIRGTYSTGFGRIFHFTLKKLKLLSTPMDDKLHGVHRINPAVPKLLLSRWQQREAELTHRQAIATVYRTALPPTCQLISHSFGDPSFLRFPLMVNNRESLIDFLKSEHIYVGDTWYDAPISPKRYLAKTAYRSGECPRAEALAAHIVNLPTHIHVTEQQATMIAEKVAQWLKSPANQ